MCKSLSLSKVVVKMETVKKQLIDFCGQTTIHGFVYLSDTTSWVLTKIIWSLLICVFLGIASFLVNVSFKDWAENPTITTIESTSAPVKELPFPSVTICQDGTSLTMRERWSIVADILNVHFYSCPKSKDEDCSSMTFVRNNQLFSLIGKTLLDKVISLDYWQGVFNTRYNLKGFDSHLSTTFFINDVIGLFDVDKVFQFVGLFVQKSLEDEPVNTPLLIEAITDRSMKAYHFQTIIDNMVDWLAENETSNATQG